MNNSSGEIRVSKEYVEKMKKTAALHELMHLYPYDYSKEPAAIVVPKKRTDG